MSYLKNLLIITLIAGAAYNGWYTFRLVRFAKDSMKWNLYVSAKIDMLEYPHCSTAREKAEKAEAALNNDKDYMSRAVK